MLKCHLEKEADKFEIEVKGNTIDILADVTALINDVYLALQENNPIMGCLFRDILRDAVNDDSSPIWKASGTHKAGKDGVKGVSVQIPGELRNLLDALREDDHGE